MFRLKQVGKSALFALGLLFIFSGCVHRVKTPPYSEVMKEARSRGVELPSLAEERAAFFAGYDVHKERLIVLINERARESEIQREYRLGPADEITISVFDVPELNLTVQVREDGTLSLPLVGLIQAEGMTEVALLNEVRKRLSGYVISPQLSLYVSTYGGHRVAVVGAVRQPGRYPLKKGANTVLELIGEAGGLTDKSGNTLSFVPAEAGGFSNVNDIETRTRLALSMDAPAIDKSSAIELYLDQVLGTAGNVPVEIPVRGGDMIIIPESGKVMVDGEVAKVGAYELGRNASLLGALAAAGGISYGAKIDEIEIIRHTGGERPHRLVVDLSRIYTGEERDYRLRSGDIVKVPSDSGRRMTQDTFESISRLINVGVGGTFRLGP